MARTVSDGGKNYVVDRSVLTCDERCLQSFGEENNVRIAEASLYGLGKNIQRGGLEGEVARNQIAYIDSLRSRGSLKDGVIQDNGSKFYVEINHRDVSFPENWSTDDEDSRVLQVCLGVKKEEPDKQTILVSKNPILRVRAHLIGIEAQEYKNDIMPELSKQYKGRIDLFASSSAIESFYTKGYLPVSKVVVPEGEKLFLNEFCILSDGNNGSALGRFDGDCIQKLRNIGSGNGFNIKPDRNVGQKFMWEALYESHEQAPLSIVKGPAGTAKTFLALAAGLTAVEREQYEAVLITRCMIETEDGMGYLPGDENLKMEPYLRGFKDNLNYLVYNSKISDMEKISRKEREATINHYFERGVLYPEPINFLRGRSIKNTYMIIDEAQNLTRPLANLIVTRAGEGTKIVFLGDCQQVDRPMYNERDNGLSYLSEKFKGQDWCWQLAMNNSESVRSRLARESSNMI